MFNHYSTARIYPQEIDGIVEKGFKLFISAIMSILFYVKDQLYNFGWKYMLCISSISRSIRRGD